MNNERTESNAFFEFHNEVNHSSMSKTSPFLLWETYEKCPLFIHRNRGKKIHHVGNMKYVHYLFTETEGREETKLLQESHKMP